MSDDPRKVLRDLLHRYGEELIDDPRRCAALLRDLCPQSNWQVRVLVDALKERVPQELGGSPSPTLTLVKSQQLVRRLETDLALTQEAARWAVESWALAIGALAEDTLSSQQPPQAAPPPPQPPPRQPAPPPRTRNVWWLGLGTAALIMLGSWVLTSQRSVPPPHVIKGPDGEWQPADGYVWALNPYMPSDMRVRWVVGRPSSRYPHVETSDTEGEWLPANGYMWVAPGSGNMRVKWTAGRGSNKYPHVEAGETEGQWRTADGYIWMVEPHSLGDMRVKWSPGRASGKYLHLVADELEGRWLPADGYTWVVNPPPPGDWRVKWTPGIASREHLNLVSTTTEGEWKPTPGFTPVNPHDPQDYRVKPVEPPAPSPSPGPDLGRSEPSAAFQDGLMYRTMWERWFAGLTGDYREGADYWSGERSSRNPGSCHRQGYSQDFVEGCLKAKEILTPTDARRNSEPDYKEGWNSYQEPSTSSSATQAPPSGAPYSEVPVRWYPDMDAPGNDLGGRDGWSLGNADDCMHKCLSDRNCVGFTYNKSRSVCIPKSRIAPLIRSDDAAITRVITDRAAPPTVSNATARVHPYLNMDFPGNDRGEAVLRVSRRDCESICVVDAGCAGYTYITQTLTCVKKNFIGGLAPSQGVVTGIVEGRNVSGH
jgi:hypothetical protein